MDQLQAYIDNLQSADPEIREGAARALHDFGKVARPAVSALLKALTTEPDACPWIGTAIIELGPSESDINEIRSALKSDNSHTRFWAARASVKLGPDGESLVPDLILLLCDENLPVRDSVVWALGSIGQAAIPSLIAAAKDADPVLRTKATVALGCYPQHAALKLPTIIDALNDRVRDVRNHAARALCSLGQAAHQDPCAYDSETLAALTASLHRLLNSSAIDVDGEWLQRILGWLQTKE